MQFHSVIKSALAALSILYFSSTPLFGGPCCDDPKVICECLNPSARCYQDTGFSASADFLYWKAGQPNLPYAFVNTDPLHQDIGFLKYIDFEWSPGVRVGLGWDTDYDGWSLNANWTWLRNKSQSSVGFITVPDEPSFPNFANLQGVHIPTIVIAVDPVLHTNTIANVALGSASASWKMMYNMFDVVLSKPYSVSRKLDLTPSIGVQGGWITRRLGLIYSTQPFESVVTELSNLNKYWGVGPRFGLDTDWKLGNCGFELFGNLAAALLFGGIFDERLYNLEEELTTSITTDSNRAQIAPTLQMVFGFGWNKCFSYSCHDYYVNLNAAWEVNYYWNLQNFLMLQGNQAGYNFPSTLDMNGLSLHASFGF